LPYTIHSSLLCKRGPGGAKPTHASKRDASNKGTPVRLWPELPWYTTLCGFNNVYGIHTARLYMVGVSEEQDLPLSMCHGYMGSGLRPYILVIRPFVTEGLFSDFPPPRMPKSRECSMHKEYDSDHGYHGVL
jgi:hypothetical protein